MQRRLSSVLTATCRGALPFSARWTTTSTPGKVKVTFVTKDGKQQTVPAVIGETLMEAARLNRIDMEAACDGTCSCSTCHVYLEKSTFDQLEKPSEDELDMLDLAPDLKPTSRLACQIKLTKDMDGMVVTLPASTESQM